MGQALSIPLNFVCGNETKTKINNIQNEIQDIRTNHLAHIETDIKIIKNDMNTIKTRIEILINR